MNIQPSVIRGQTLRNVLTTRTWRLVFVGGCLLILGLGLYRQIRPQSYQLANSDFYTYYNAALAVRHGVNPFIPVASWIKSYIPGNDLTPTYYVYAPFFALLLTPFTLVPFQVALTLWGLCNLLFLLGTIYAFLRTAGNRPTLMSFLGLATTASLLNTIRIEFYWGQADIFLLWCICAAFWARLARHPILGGILLAVACVIKPPLLVFVAFLVWKREFKFATATILTFLGLFLTPFLWLGAQAWRDQLAIWSFWSSQYVSFIDNYAPKGVLARLFTMNPYVHPLFVAPALATALWLVVVAVVVVLTVAVVSPQPLQRDTRSLLEIGLVISALLLISPLTEYIYVTLLLFPLLTLYLFVRQNGWKSLPSRQVGIALLASWLLLCLPLQNIEYFLWPRMATPSLLADLYVVLAVPYLYILIAFFALQLYTLYLVSGRSTSLAVRHLIVQAPYTLSHPYRIYKQRQEQ